MTGPLGTLEEIWEIRRRLETQFAGDVQKKIAFYRQLDSQPGVKIFRRSSNA